MAETLPTTLEVWDKQIKTYCITEINKIKILPSRTSDPPSLTDPHPPHPHPWNLRVSKPIIAVPSCGSRGIWKKYPQYLGGGKNNASNLVFKINGRNFESKISSTQWCLWINYLQSLEHNIETVLLLRTFWTWQVKFQVYLIIGITPKYPENIPFLTGPLCTTSSSRSSPDRWSPPIHDGQRYPSGILGFLQRCHEAI